ncbi:threonine/serine ThrE exporter family protein [Microbacterium luticocti]|uniref:threonine/serine ThrE exporter family protein n=1 Tax=Microbacterium luticocti TaxID=451764 RepID=UPI00048F4840|nr:threonine/serine exporter family protein [Microbacterium luticocti]
MNDAARTRAVLDLAIRLAMLQLEAGAGAQDATATMTGVSRAFGLRGTDADVTSTELTLSWTDPTGDDAITRRHIISRRGLDYHRLAAAAGLYDEILGHRIDLVTARRRLPAITGGRPLFPPLVQRIGWGVVGAGAGILLGGGMLVAAVAFVTGFLLDLISVTLGRRGVPLLFQTFVGGAVGPVAAVLVHLVDPEASASLIVVATIIVLLAGVTVFGGVQDVLTAFYVTGLARITEGFVATIGLAGGVIATSLLLNRLGAPLAISVNEAQPESAPLIASAAAVIIVIGFAFGTQLPWRALWVVCVLAVIVEAVFLACTLAGLGAVWGSAVAAVTVGVVASPLTRLTRTPVLPLIVTAVIPLLPGLVLFNGMMQVASEQVDGLLDIFRAAAIAGALSAGTIFGHYLVRFIGGRTRTLRLGRI